jgi:hypothetical protein
MDLMLTDPGSRFVGDSQRSSQMLDTHFDFAASQVQLPKIKVACGLRLPVSNFFPDLEAFLMELFGFLVFTLILFQATKIVQRPRFTDSIVDRSVECQTLAMFTFGSAKPTDPLMGGSDFRLAPGEAGDRLWLEAPIHNGFEDLQSLPRVFKGPGMVTQIVRTRRETVVEPSPLQFIAVLICPRQGLEGVAQSHLVVPQAFVDIADSNKNETLDALIAQLFGDRSGPAESRKRVTVIRPQVSFCGLHDLNPAFTSPVFQLPGVRANLILKPEVQIPHERITGVDLEHDVDEIRRYGFR